MTAFQIVAQVVFILIVVFLALGLIFGVTIFGVQAYGARRAEAARQRFPNAKLILGTVSCFGQQSRGMFAARGNGTLVLTSEELYFEQWLPHREVSIPLRSIQSIETPTSFMGKTRFTPILKVTFWNEAGQSDAIAWQVRDLEGFKQTLDGLLPR